jgi:hypothetical protein
VPLQAQSPTTLQSPAPIISVQQLQPPLATDSGEEEVEVKDELKDQTLTPVATPSCTKASLEKLPEAQHHSQQCQYVSQNASASPQHLCKLKN